MQPELALQNKLPPCGQYILKNGIENTEFVNAVLST
jgi:hypothetical protein